MAKANTVDPIPQSLKDKAAAFQAKANANIAKLQAAQEKVDAETQQINDLSQALINATDCQVLYRMVKEFLSKIIEKIKQKLGLSNDILDGWLAILDFPKNIFKIIKYIVRAFIGPALDQLIAFMKLIRSIIRLVQAIVNLIKAVQIAVQRVIACAKTIAQQLIADALSPITDVINNIKQEIANGLEQIAAFQQQLKGVLGDFKSLQGDVRSFFGGSGQAGQTFYNLSAGVPLESGEGLTNSAVSAAGPVLIGNSSTVATIGLGTFNFVINGTVLISPLVVGLGDRVRAIADPYNFMEGIVIALSGNNLTINVDLIYGSGKYTSWELFDVNGSRYAGGVPFCADDAIREEQLGNLNLVDHGNTFVQFDTSSPEAFVDSYNTHGDTFRQQVKLFANNPSLGASIDGPSEVVIGQSVNVKWESTRANTVYMNKIPTTNSGNLTITTTDVGVFNIQFVAARANGMNVFTDVENVSYTVVPSLVVYQSYQVPEAGKGVIIYWSTIGADTLTIGGIAQTSSTIANGEWSFATDSQGPQTITLVASANGVSNTQNAEYYVK